MDMLIREDCSSNSILLGDFNLHHELWAGSQVPTSENSRKLASAVTSHNLRLCNVPGAVTYSRSASPDSSHSTIDLTFLGEFLAPRLVDWSVVDVEGFKSDHRVVRTKLDCPPNRQISVRRRWKETSEEDFRCSVEKNLSALPRPHLDSVEGIDQGLWEIVRALEAAVEEHVPIDDDCEPSQAAPSTQPKKEKTYQEAVSSATAGNPRKTFTWARQARRRAKPTQNPFTPDFKYNGKTAKTAYEKANMYMDAIYGEGKTSRERSVHPRLPQNIDLSMPEGHQLERMVPGDKRNPGEVLRSIKSLPDRKATGIDIIGNEALKMAGDIVTPYLEEVFAACLSKGHYPKWLKFSRTILFSKPKKNPEEPTSYRPIALLTSVGKVLEKLIVRRMKRALKLLPKFCALPLRQFGGLPGKSTTAALHCLVNFVLTGWAKGQKVSVLGLDISGAFPHVDRNKLIELLVDKGIPGYLIMIIWSWLCNRQTILEIPGEEGQLFFENGGLPQGSCLSPFIFLIFAGPLFDIDSLGINVMFQIFAFVDDTYIMVRSPDFEKNCKALEWIHAQLLRWSSDSDITFDPAKYGLLHFLNAKERHSIITERPSIDDLPDDKDLFEHPFLDILGVRVDNRLSWEYHVEKIRAGVSKKLRCLKEISGANWGPDLDGMRMLYTSQIQPVFSYASPAWFIVGPRSQRGTISRKLMKILDTLQAECLTEISGAMKNTSFGMLRKELCIPKLSIHLRMKTISYFAKKLGCANYAAMRIDRQQALDRRQLNKHTFEHLQLQADDVAKCARGRLEHIHGPHAAIEIWNKEHLRIRAIEKITMQTIHDQCSYEWEQYRKGWRQTHSWTRPLALYEQWGRESMYYHEGLSRKQSTILLHCRTGHIGLAAHLYRFRLYPTDRCPFCNDGPHTVEHLFIHCTGRDCTGRSMPFKRAALYNRAEGTTDLRTIFVEHPAEAANFALQRFGIPQFTKASWQVKAARNHQPTTDTWQAGPARKRGRPPGGDDAAEPATKRSKYTYLDLGPKGQRKTTEAGTTG